MAFDPATLRTIERTRAIDVWHTDCYEATDDGWQVVWSQATAIDD